MAFEFESGIFFVLRTPLPLVRSHIVHSKQQTGLSSACSPIQYIFDILTEPNTIQLEKYIGEVFLRLQRETSWELYRNRF